MCPGMRQLHDRPEHGCLVGPGTEVCRAVADVTRRRRRLHRPLHLQADTFHRCPLRLLHRDGRPGLSSMC